MGLSEVDFHLSFKARHLIFEICLQIIYLIYNKVEFTENDVSIYNDI